MNATNVFAYLWKYIIINSINYYFIICSVDTLIAFLLYNKKPSNPLNIAKKHDMMYKELNVNLITVLDKRNVIEAILKHIYPYFN